MMRACGGLTVEVADAVTPDPDPITDPVPNPDPLPDPTPTPDPTPANIQNAAELATALSAGSGTYFLAGGDYGILPDVPSGTTLIAADLSNKPVFGPSNIVNRDGITLDGLHFKYTYAPGDADHAGLVYASDLTNCVMRNCLIEGDRNGNGSCIGRGVRMWGSNDTVLFEGNEFRTLWKAIGVNGDNITLRANNIHTFRSDGINTGPVINFVAESNYIHDADTVEFSSDHRDSIQMMGTADGVILRDNFIDMGQGLYSQSIWSDSKNFMDNVTLTGNIIINSHTNGIALHNVGKIDVTGNQMVWLPRNNAASQGVQTPKVNIGSGQATVTGNTVPGIVSPSGVDALNTIQDGDPDVTRAAARDDSRWAHFFGG